MFFNFFSVLGYFYGSLNKIWGGGGGPTHPIIHIIPPPVQKPAGLRRLAVVSIRLAQCEVVFDLAAGCHWKLRELKADLFPPLCLASSLWCGG